MKKCISLVLAIAMTAMLLCVPAMAQGDALIKIIMSTDKVTATLSDGVPEITPEEMQAAVDTALEDPEFLFPEKWDITADRMTVYQQRAISCELPVYDVTFKFWSTSNCPVCIFFLAEDSETWELLSCEMGDVAEARFNGNGVYAIARCW